MIFTIVKKQTTKLTVELRNLQLISQALCINLQKKKLIKEKSAKILNSATTSNKSKNLINLNSCLTHF
jgi:hypothetical protein